MKINAYLSFNGNCLEAFQFYEQSIGGKIGFKITYGESPMADQCAPAERERIMHIRLEVGDQLIMGADAPPQFAQKAQGFSVCLNPTEIAEAERLFKALAEGATAVQMPLQETFWADRFAVFTDKFGTPWMINCEKQV